jgi:hypothetical protein
MSEPHMVEAMIGGKWPRAALGSSMWGFGRLSAFRRVPKTLALQQASRAVIYSPETQLRATDDKTARSSTRSRA